MGFEGISSKKPPLVLVAKTTRGGVARITPDLMFHDFQIYNFSCYIEYQTQCFLSSAISHEARRRRNFRFQNTNMMICLRASATVTQVTVTVRTPAGDFEKQRLVQVQGTEWHSARSAEKPEVRARFKIQNGTRREAPITIQNVLSALTEPHSFVNSYQNTGFFFRACGAQFIPFHVNTEWPRLNY